MTTRQLGLPTAARLVAALTMAAAGAAVYLVLAHLYPDGADPKIRFERNMTGFLGLFCCVGLFVGWRGLGTRADGHEGSGMTLGLQSMLAATIWVAGLMALRYGAVKMRKNAYGSNTVAAILDMFNQGMYYLSFVLEPMVLGTLVVSGILCGMLSVQAGRVWK